MKDIGEQLKKARESMGVSIEEVAEDLKLQPNQIEEIENGNTESFQDVFSIKYFIRDYAKYLGLNSEELVDEFNEFLFDYTSRIPLEEIEKAKLNNINKKEISSPYTNTDSNNKEIKIVLAVVGVVILFIIGYFIMSNIEKNDFEDENITYVIRR